MDEEKCLSGINYYARLKHYRHVQIEAQDGLKKLGNDPGMHFWKAFGILMEGRVPEAMRELQTLKDKQEVSLAVALALIYAHKQSKTVDKEAVSELEGQTKGFVKSSGEIGLQHAAMFLWHTGRHDKARDLCDKLTKMNASNQSGPTLRGWVDITSGKDSYMKKSIKYFDEALKQDETPAGRKKRVDALFGKIMYLQQMKNDYKGSLQLIDFAVVDYPNYLPALIEKAKAQLALCDWDQVLETAQRCLDIDDKCIEALRLVLLHTLARKGNYQEAARRLGELVSSLDQHEGRSHSAYYNVAAGPSRLSGRNSQVLLQVQTLMNRALSISPSQADYVTEVGYLNVLNGQDREAMKSYKQAMALDETSVAALNGIILCQLLDNQLEDAEQQLEFLNEIQASIGKSANVSYLSALLASKQNESPEKVVKLLDEAVETHLKSLEGKVWSHEFFVQLNPEFMLEIAKLYLQYAPTEAPLSGEAAHPVLNKCCKVLEALTKSAPGFLEGVYVLAKAKYLSGQIEAAQSGAQYCLKQDLTFADAHLLMARIHLSQGNPAAAGQSLEVGLSYSFEVRESPMYHLINANIQKAGGKHEEAIRTLHNAMKLPGVRRAVKQVAGQKKKSKKTITIGDRVSVFLELAKTHWEARHPHEAAKVMQDAINEFSGTPEETRVAIANADLAVMRGEVEGALTMLRSITPDKSYFVQAKEKMAQIYLEHRKDKRLFAACYRDLVDQSPSTHTSILLGDAYMSIQEPEKAIAVYESALKQNPRNGVLASKIGNALVKTHAYQKAINYYEAAVKAGDQASLRADLAQLYLKLKQFDKAEKVLTAALAHEESNDLTVMQADVKYMVLQAQLLTDAEQAVKGIAFLQKAHQAQARVLSRVATEQPEAHKQQQQLAAEICIKMAAYYETSAKDVKEATQCYQEALRHDNTNAKAMLALAKLYLSHSDLDAAQFQLTQLLKHDKHNNDATVMLADLMFRKNEYDDATFHFQKLLEREPQHYEALAKLIDLLQRAGKLHTDGQKFLNVAEKASSHPDTEPGLNYCKGLYARFTHVPNEAVKCFNLARRDSHFGIRALYAMIEICLNPENDTVGGETFEGGSDTAAVQMGVKTANDLLGELRNNGEQNALKYKLLENYSLLATKNKSMVEKALAEFMNLASEYEAVGAILGMARSYMLLKQVPKARQQLKRISGMTWTSANADEFEGAWLLLADIYISSAKFDLAQGLLKKTLQHNKSCSKAWEYMGYIMEKEQSYADASEFYENAWAFSNESDAAIGYKLAFNYLKATRYVEAIDVSHLVLKKNPEFPKIKKEILDKARAGLRL